MHDFMKLLIPLFALCIPLVAIVGRQIVRPLTEVIGRLAEQQARLGSPRQNEAEMAELQGRLEQMERVLAKVVDEQEFQRALLESGSRTEVRPISASPSER
jgi:hypothetical protein